MKAWRIVTVLLLCLVLAGSTACRPFGEEEPEVTEQLVEVVRGDLTVTVSGSGNLEVSNEMELAFGVGGRVDKIYVEEGDEVSESEVLAKLETDTLELALAQAQVARVQAQAARAQARVAQVQAQAAQTQAQAAQAQALVVQAQAGAARAQALVALDAAEENLDNAEDLLDRVKKFLPKTHSKVKDAESLFETAELQYEAALAQVEAAQAQLEAAQAQLKAADSQFELAISQLNAANLQYEVAQAQLDVSELALTEAQKQLDEATIIAPFDGVVARVPLDEGNTISTAITVVHLIDPSSMQLKVQVDEIDVVEVKLEQRAIIEVDALPALPLEGKVSSISLLPTQEAGLIVYDVKIEFDIPEGTGLRAGMSATADIIITERNGVLLVPNRAISQDSQGNHVVEVMVNDQIEERAVDIGISDGFQTEIVDGLEEGEVVVERRTKPKSAIPGFF